MAVQDAIPVVGPVRRGGALKTFVGIEQKFEDSFQKGTAIDPTAGIGWR